MQITQSQSSADSTFKFIVTTYISFCNVIAEFSTSYLSWNLLYSLKVFSILYLVEDLLFSEFKPKSRRVDSDINKPRAGY
jgi:hypothetical protein